MAHNRVTDIQAVTGMFLALVWITLGMRVYVKHFMTKSYALEDWLAVLATVLFSCMAVCFFGASIHTLGLDQIAVSKSDLAPAMEYWYFGELSYVLAICAIKISVAVFLLRIIVEKIQRLVLWIAIGIITVVTAIFFFVVMFQCSPVDAAWSPKPHGTPSCIPSQYFGGVTYTHSAVSATGDLLLAIMPIVVVSRLQMNPRTKITVCLLLSMGLSAFIASIIRLPYVRLLVQTPSNFTYLSVNVALWSAIEPGLAITAANLAVLKPLFSTFFSRARLWHSPTAATTQNTSQNPFASSHRRGYMRSTSGGNTIDMGLQNMEQPGHSTNIMTRDHTAGNGKSQIWNTDLELGTSTGDATKNWLSGITKTVRLDVRSENGEETYADIIANLNSNSKPPRKRRVRDLGEPMPRPHVRHERSDSTLTKLAKDETTRIFGLSSTGQNLEMGNAKEGSGMRGGGGRICSPEPTRTDRFRMRSPILAVERKISAGKLMLAPIRTIGGAGANTSVLSLVISDIGGEREDVGVVDIGKGKGEIESPAGFGLGIWKWSETSPGISEAGSGGRRVSHAYQNSD